MGYILPITQYQYRDYQNRVIKDELDPYYIEHPYKVILDTESREMEEGGADRDKGKLLKNSHPYEQPHLEKPTNEKLYAKLTGKGQHFSENI